MATRYTDNTCVNTGLFTMTANP